MSYLLSRPRQVLARPAQDLQKVVILRVRPGPDRVWAGLANIGRYCTGPRRFDGQYGHIFNMYLRGSEGSGSGRAGFDHFGQTVRMAQTRSGPAQDLLRLGPGIPYQHVDLGIGCEQVLSRSVPDLLRRGPDLLRRVPGVPGVPGSRNPWIPNDSAYTGPGTPPRDPSWLRPLSGSSHPSSTKEVYMSCAGPPFGMPFGIPFETVSREWQ